MYKNKLLMVSISTLTLLLFFQINLAAKEILLSFPDSSIVITPLPLPNPNIPKAPTQLPISAYYEPSIPAVYLSFVSNLGEIEVEVLNSTTGGFCSAFIDTRYLYAVIPITFGPGHYIITFTLPSGQQYQGEFNKP